jgi:hypothetical protein
LLSPSYLLKGDAQAPQFILSLSTPPYHAEVKRMLAECTVSSALSCAVSSADAQHIPHNGSDAHW